MKEKVKAIALKNPLFAETFYFSALVSAAILAPFIGVQLITGSIVNATLFLAAYLIGVGGAVLVAVVPSILALTMGFLPAVLAPMVPFIIGGNIILVLIFSYFKDKKLLFGILSASFVKFLFLYASGYVVINLLLKNEAAASVANMMSWPQLLTALTGGVIAVFILKAIKKI
ncbi:MAG: hypothetical protein ACQEP6_02675 [Patescibacteria group bacterium]